MLNDDFYENEVDIMLNENIDFWFLNDDFYIMLY